MSEKEKFLQIKDVKLFRKKLNEKYDVYSALDFIKCNGIWLASALNLYYYDREKNEDFLYQTVDIFDQRTMCIRDVVKNYCNNSLTEIKDHYEREIYSVERVEAIINHVKKMNENRKNKFVR